jgi:two-component system invasion response regulator UvrY
MHVPSPPGRLSGRLATEVSGIRDDRKRDGSGKTIAEVGQLCTTVLVVDDNVAYRRALCRVIEAAGSVVAGEAATGEDAIEMTRMLRPQIVLMDVHMPGVGGIEAARQIALLQPEVKVVLITLSVGELGKEINESGLRCLLKETIRPDTLRVAIAAACSPRT